MILKADFLSHLDVIKTKDEENNTEVLNFIFRFGNMNSQKGEFGE